MPLTKECHERLRFSQIELCLEQPIHETGAEVFFNWRPAKQTYDARIDNRAVKLELHRMPAN